MTTFDWGVVAVFVVSMCFWGRGVWRRNVLDVALAGVVMGVGVLMFIYFYAYVTLSGAPWIAGLVAAGIGGVVAVVKRRDARPLRFAGVLAMVSLVVAVLLFVGEERWSAGANSLQVIAPYRHAGTWAFDDPITGLVAEPFVEGVPELIDRMVADAKIPDADKGIRLIFSAKPFPGYQCRFVWRRAEWGGNWYYSEEYGREGWLCSSLFKYFKRAPKEIYAKVEKCSRCLTP